MYESVANSKISPIERQSLIQIGAHQLAREARQCGLSPSTYLKLAIAFYQSDCSTYTADSLCESANVRGSLSMEFLFEQAPVAALESPQPTLVFDSVRSRLTMRGIFEDALRALEDAVREIDSQDM